MLDGGTPMTRKTFYKHIRAICHQHSINPRMYLEVCARNLDFSRDEYGVRMQCREWNIPESYSAIWSKVFDR